MNAYSDAFNKAIAFVLPHENEYARGHWGDDNYVVTENVSGDRGGLTKWGLDKRGNPELDIANLTKSQAVDAYWRKYWNPHNLDQLPARLAIACFDVWVNGGHAVLWLQEAINQTGWIPKLSEDGIMGAITIAAAQTMAGDRSQQVVVNFIAERNARFEAIVANNPSQRKFLKGWEQRDIGLQNYLNGISG